MEDYLQVQVVMAGQVLLAMQQVVKATLALLAIVEERLDSSVA